MKLKLLFLSLLLPVLALILIITATIFLKDFYVSIASDLAYIIVIFMSIKICDIHFKNRNWFPEPKQILVNIVLAVALFGIFYLEKVIIGSYTKGIFQGIKFYLPF